MLIHFLKRDFATYRAFWVVLVLMTLIATPFLGSREDQALFILAYLYFFFAVSPLSSLVGVTWRSQHVMSRNYLLSLPVPRRKMFRWLQYRSYVFWVPYLALCFWAPLLSRGFWRFLVFLKLGYLEYVSACFLGIFWFINSGITMQLLTERITGYLHLRLRFLAWVAMVGGFLLEIVILMAPLAGAQRWGLGAAPYLALLLIMGIGHYLLARKLWIWR